MITILDIPGNEYHFLHDNHAHLRLKVESGEEKVSYVVTAVAMIGHIFNFVISEL